MASADFHFVISPVTEAQLVERLAQHIARHLTENRHPDGVAPNVLAEDLVYSLRAEDHLWTREDLDRLEKEGA